MWTEEWRKSDCTGKEVEGGGNEYKTAIALSHSTVTAKLTMTVFSEAMARRTMAVFPFLDSAEWCWHFYNILQFL